MTSFLTGARECTRRAWPSRGDRIAFRDVADRTSCRSASAWPTACRSRRPSGAGRCASSATRCAPSRARGSPTSSSRACELAAASPPDPRRASSARSTAPTCVIVENVCSLPLNAAASLTLVAALLEGRPAVLHHHDLPWQRPQFAHHVGPPTDPAWRHVTINERSSDELADRGIAASSIPNHFDLDPPPGRPRRDAGGDRGATPVPMLVVHPVRAIPRKNVGGGAAARRAARRGVLARRRCRGRVRPRARPAARRRANGRRGSASRRATRSRTSTRRATSSCCRRPGRGSGTPRSSPSRSAVRSRGARIR